MDAKYTNDGRKVVVIGKLNSTETIVQEIFVTADGAEIPSGEQFIVKGLHNAPCESWHDKRVRVMEERHDRLSKDLELYERNAQMAKRNAANRIRALKAIASNVVASQLATLEMFVAGNITHLVKCTSYDCRIVPFDGELQSSDCGIDDNVRLLTLFGRSDGNMAWKLNHYSDGSGSSSDVFPCDSPESAVAAAQAYYDDMVDKWRNSDRRCPPNDDWMKTPEYKDAIEVPSDLLEHLKAEAERKRNERIAKLEAELAELKA